MGTREIADGTGADRGWEAILNDVAEGFLELSDEDALTQTEQAGDNVAATAAGVRQLLLGEVKAFRQARLQEALVEYQRNAQRFREGTYPIPKEPADRRQLLSALFQRLPQMGQNALTLQHRDFKTLSEADIEGLLKQLEALGVFPKDVSGKE